MRGTSKFELAPHSVPHIVRHWASPPEAATPVNDAIGRRDCFESVAARSAVTGLHGCSKVMLLCQAKWRLEEGTLGLQVAACVTWGDCCCRSPAKLTISRRCTTAT